MRKDAGKAIAEALAVTAPSFLVVSLDDRRSHAPGSTGRTPRLWRQLQIVVRAYDESRIVALLDRGSIWPSNRSQWSCAYEVLCRYLRRFPNSVLADHWLWHRNGVIARLERTWNADLGKRLPAPRIGFLVAVEAFPGQWEITTTGRDKWGDLPGVEPRSREFFRQQNREDKALDFARAFAKTKKFASTPDNLKHAAIVAAQLESFHGNKAWLRRQQSNRTARPVGTGRAAGADHVGFHQ